MEKVKEALRRYERLYQGLSFLRCWKVSGKKEALRRYREHWEEKRIREEICRANALSEEERQRQEKTMFSRVVTYSITVPLYNTPEAFLREMLDSVRGQTWKQWELCLADGSDPDHAYVGEIAREAAAADSRIRYSRLEKNGGISENTNRCIEMATGEYIVMLEGDDYWTCDDKLQKQADFLDEHRDYVAVFARHIIVDENDIRHEEMEEYIQRC